MRAGSSGVACAASQAATSSAGTTTAPPIWAYAPYGSSVVPTTVSLSWTSV
ncbi:Uncharacterised protein [Mycobacteroides abscessus]|nr:Uncharacterised protein [Mycobacteroides abscessus]